MKKIILLTVMLCLLFVVLSGCGAENYSSEEDTPHNEVMNLRPIEPMRIHSSLDGYIRMVVDEIDYNRVVVTIFNDSKYELTTSHHYRIEFYDERGWMWIVSDAPFVDEGLVVLPYDSITLTKNNLNFVVGTLLAGQYRIRKSVFRDIDIPITADDHHDLVAGFQVD